MKHHSKRYRRQAGLGLLVAVSALTATSLMATPGSFAASEAPAQEETIDATAPQYRYPGSPQEEANVLRAERDRLSQIKNLHMRGELTDDVSSPYVRRIDTPGRRSVALPARPDPYTLPEIAKLVDSPITMEESGIARIHEHLLVLPGATLDVTHETVRGVQLVSGSSGFVSIINDGGQLNIVGTPEQPLTVTSWSPDVSAPDTKLTDGRAYIRSVNGVARLQHLSVQHLGFWGGATSGLSVAGAMPAPPQPVVTALESRDTVNSLPPGGATLPNAEISDDDAPPGTITGPDGAPMPSTEDPKPPSIHNVHTIGNAFGIHVPQSVGLELRDSSFEDSIVDAVVLGRRAAGTKIHHVTVKKPGRHGFVLGSGVSEVQVSDSSVEDSGIHGILISGPAGQQQPAQSQEALPSYGRNRIERVTARRSGSNGIQLVGGTGVSIVESTVERARFGISLTRDATETKLERNTITESTERGVSLGSGTGQTVLSGNTIRTAPVGVRVHTARADLFHNTLEHINGSAVTVTGLSKVSLTNTTMGGTGPKAVQVASEAAETVHEVNSDTSKWIDSAPNAAGSTGPLSGMLSRLTQPLSMLWIGVFAVLAISTYVGFRARRRMRTAGPDLLPLYTDEDIVYVSPALRRPEPERGDPERQLLDVTSSQATSPAPGAAR